MPTRALSCIGLQAVHPASRMPARRNACGLAAKDHHLVNASCQGARRHPGRQDQSGHGRSTARTAGRVRRAAMVPISNGLPRLEATDRLTRGATVSHMPSFMRTPVTQAEFPEPSRSTAQRSGQGSAPEGSLSDATLALDGENAVDHGLKGTARPAYVKRPTHTV